MLKDITISFNMFFNCFFYSLSYIAEYNKYAFFLTKKLFSDIWGSWEGKKEEEEEEEERERES